MNNTPQIVFIWDGHSMVPPDTLLPALQRSLTAGNTYRMIVAEEGRSIEQNNKMWALLSDVSRQATLRDGQKFDPDEWKVIFLHALGREIKLLPAMEGNAFVPYGLQSSKLTKAEMSELIEFIYAEGTKRGVVFKDDPVNHVQTG